MQCTKKLVCKQVSKYVLYIKKERKSKEITLEFTPEVITVRIWYLLDSDFKVNSFWRFPVAKSEIQRYLCFWNWRYFCIFSYSNSFTLKMLELTLNVIPFEGLLYQVCWWSNFAGWTLAPKAFNSIFVLWEAQNGANKYIFCRKGPQVHSIGRFWHGFGCTEALTLELRIL